MGQMTTRLGLSPKSRALARGGLGWGAANSGKTFGFASHAAKFYARNPGRHLMIGSSLSLMIAEAIPDVQAIAENYGVTTTDYNRAKQSFTVGKSRIIVRAGAKAGDEKRLRSIHNMRSLLCEEVSDMPEVFFDMAVSRMRMPRGPVWASCNPTDPMSWVKQRLDDGRWGADQMFLVRDNPALTPEQVEEYESQFSGIFHQRMIQGLWVAPEGLVYPHWTDVAPDPKRSAEMAGRPCYVGADYGKSSVTSAHYVQPAGDGTWLVVGEYYWDAAKRGERASPKHAEEIKAQAPGPIVGAYVDPSARDLRDALMRKGVNAVPAYNKADGYGILDGMLQRGLMRIVSANCPELVTQLYTLIWNKHGDAPDLNCVDHATDDLRYVGCGLSHLRAATAGREIRR